jgi:hypothetical protein
MSRSFDGPHSAADVYWGIRSGRYGNESGRWIKRLTHRRERRLGILSLRKDPESASKRASF